MDYCVLGCMLGSHHLGEVPHVQSNGTDFPWQMVAVAENEVAPPAQISALASS